MAQAARDDLQARAVRLAAQHGTAAAMIGGLRLAAEKGPVAPALGPEREIKIAFRSPGAGAEALPSVAARHAPEQFLRLQILPSSHAVRDYVQGAPSENVKIVAAYLEVVDLGVRRETIEQLASQIAALPVWFIDKERLAPADE